jgi:hypothetical protein
MVIMGAGALFVGWAPWRWASAVGALVGLLFAVGVLISPAGLTNLLGEAGPTVSLGQGIEVVGALTAVIAGLIATSRRYRIHADAS